MMHELAELYVLDALSADERASFERELERDEGLRKLVDTLRETAGRLGLGAPAVEPPAHLRGQVLAAAVPPMHLLREAGIEWAPSGVDGVDVCMLYDDSAKGRQTVLVRMAPGASYPRRGPVRPRR